MAGRGPAPKPGGGVGRRKRPVREVEGGERAAPAPPDGEGEWSAAALKWWRAVSTAAVAELWRDEDWTLVERGLLLAARFDHEMKFGEPRIGLACAAELRRIEGSLGLTPADRLRMGVAAKRPARTPPVAPPPSGGTPGPVSMSAARARFRGGGGDAVAG